MRANKKETGAQGELLAARWLENNGFIILERNWRYSHYEIDLVAHRDNLLHIVEVKTRVTDEYGYPEENISRKKMLHIMKAAEAYMNKNPQWKRVQYDVLSIILGNKNEPDFFFAEDVYLD